MLRRLVQANLLVGVLFCSPLQLNGLESGDTLYNPKSPVADSSRSPIGRLGCCQCEASFVPKPKDTNLTGMEQDSLSVKAINEMLGRWATAIREGDLDEIASLVTEDAEFWTHGQPSLMGREALKQAFEPFFAQFEMHQDFRCEELLVLSDYAFMRGLEVNRLVPRDGGEPMEVRQRAFSLLRRGGDGRWRFARGMSNLPPEE